MWEVLEDRSTLFAQSALAAQAMLRRLGFSATWDINNPIQHNSPIQRRKIAKDNLPFIEFCPFARSLEGKDRAVGFERGEEIGVVEWLQSQRRRGL